MKIMHVITRGAGGGTEIALSWSIQKELEQGHEVLLIASNYAISKRVKNLETASFKMVLLPELQKGLTLRGFYVCLRVLRKITREYRPDVMHTHETVAGIFGRIVRVGRFTIRLHTVHMSVFGNSPIIWHFWLYWPLEYLLSKRTDIYIFVGKGLLRQYDSLGLRAKSGSVFAPSNFEVEKFEVESLRKNENREWILEQINVQHDENLKIIISVGMLERRKRHLLLLKRISAILNQDLILILIGNGKEEERLKRFVSRESLERYVFFLPHTPYVAKYIAGANLVAHASVLEGLSQVLLQSRICKTQAIATKNVGTEELSDLYVIPTNGNQMSEKVLEVLNNYDNSFKFDYAPWKEEESRLIYLEVINLCKDLILKKRMGERK